MVTFNTYLKMPVVYKYRIYCQTQAKYVFHWGVEPPTVCPENTSDTIDTGNITNVDSVEENKVTINEGDAGTNGLFKYKTYSIVTCGTGAENTGSTGSVYLDIPIDTSIVGGALVSKDHQEDDNLLIDIGPLTVGVLTADYDGTGTEISVSSTVIDNIYRGYHCVLTDGVNTTDLTNMIIQIDTENNILTMEHAYGQSFSASSPTYVQMYRIYCSVDKLGPGGSHSIGATLIGGTILKKNTPVRFYYENKSGQRTIATFHMEYMY